VQHSAFGSCNLQVTIALAVLLKLQTTDVGVGAEASLRFLWYHTGATSRGGTALEKMHSGEA